MKIPPNFMEFAKASARNGLDVKLYGQIVSRPGLDLRALEIRHSNGYSITGFVKFMERGFELFMPVHDSNHFGDDIDVLLERAKSY